MVEDAREVQCAIVETNPKAWKPTGRLLEIPAQGDGFEPGDFMLVIVRSRERISSFVVRLKSKGVAVWVSEVLEAA